MRTWTVKKGQGPKATSVKKHRWEEEDDTINPMDAAAKVALRAWNKMDEDTQADMKLFFDTHLKAGYKRLGKIIRGVDWTKKRGQSEDDE